MTFGYSEFIADFLWLRAIQDFDFCSEQIEGSRDCKGQSWLFQMLDQATTLSPNFLIIYRAGSMALSVVISDIQGATKLFEKGLRHFPNEWPLLYRAAYHALYEEKNKLKAAELMRRAGENGAPKWTLSLAGGLMAESGQRQLAEALLAEMRANNEDPQIIKRLEEKLQKVPGS